jgi:hypothetical protein
MNPTGEYELFRCGDSGRLERIECVAVTSSEIVRPGYSDEMGSLPLRKFAGKAIVWHILCFLNSATWIAFFQRKPDAMDRNVGWAEGKPVVVPVADEFGGARGFGKVLFCFPAVTKRGGADRALQHQ